MTKFLLNVTLALGEIMLSVIICVYNTDEKLFEKCLKSIFNSTLQDLEVIVVDDGSTKDYSYVLNNFKQIKYFKTENKGTLSARLFGIKQATSPYVCFVDSDDTISFNYFETSVTSADNYDIVINDWAFHTEKARYVCLNDSTITTEIDSTNPLSLFFSKQGREHSYYVLWNKIYKRDVLLSVCEKIESLNLGKLVYAEDVLMSYFAFQSANKIKNVHGGYYFYRVHSSQQVAINSQSKLQNHINSVAQVFNIIENNLTTNNVYQEYSTSVHNWKQMLCSNFYSEAKSMNALELYETLKNNFKDCKLTKPSSTNGKAYNKQQLLPENIEDIDKMLKQICISNSQDKIFVKKNSYAHLTLLKLQKYLNKTFNISFKKKNANIVFPKEQISLKQKILHNYFVFKLGMFLFPKGSKIRKFLKEKL